MTAMGSDQDDSDEIHPELRVETTFDENSSDGNYHQTPQIHHEIPPLGTPNQRDIQEHHQLNSANQEHNLPAAPTHHYDD